MACHQYFPIPSPTLWPGSFYSKTSSFFINQKHKKLSSRAKINDQEDNNIPRNEQNSTLNSLSKLDRRNILLGLGGLYGGATAANLTPDALAAPVDVTKCGEATTLPAGVAKIDCCPPSNETIIDFKFPPPPKILRVRPAAHLADEKYIARYSKAIALMKALPKDDPHSFTQQAGIHCAYCDSSYQMVGFPDVKVDVHFSWLFFPFHRLYLYFYEKILGKLIDDPTFALPYWNWDSPPGMPIPAMFANPYSPLYDKLRDAKHQPPLKIDLNYSKKNPSSTDEKRLIASNLSLMYKQMVSGSKTPRLFFGNAYGAGDAQAPGMGAVENHPHTPIHIWTGDPTQPNGEDMGRFYSAGRDPIFYVHHANVDRMWNIWKTLPGRNRKDIKDPDYLNAAFLFYDENKQLVRVKVKDSLDSRKLGYVYQDVDIPWLGYRPKPKQPRGKNKSGIANAAELPVEYPKLLDNVVKVVVPRPKKSRSKAEKEDEEEILVVDGIEFDGNVYVKFDVFINDEDEAESGPENAEFAGSFSNVPLIVKKKVKTCLKLGISELLEDLGADDDDEVLVAIVPKSGKGEVSIGGIKIEISS